MHVVKKFEILSFQIFGTSGQKLCEKTLKEIVDGHESNHIFSLLWCLLLKGIVLVHWENPRKKSVAARRPLQVDDGAPEYPTNLQECLKLKLDDPAEEVLGGASGSAQRQGGGESRRSG